MNVIIACQTLRDEVEKALKDTGVKYPVLWIDSGLHNYPDKLKTKLQEQIDRISNTENLILVFGNCGNALNGIRATTGRLVLPKIDDCISLLLGSVQKRMEISREAHSYFLTCGWLAHESNIVKEHKRCLEKYGEVRGQKIFKAILAHYRKVILLDTNAYPLHEIEANVKRFAGDVGLDFQVVPGTLSYLKKLFTGPWDEDFIVVERGEKITFEMFGFINQNFLQISG
ncbi:hypothetical protein ciss_11340 [Carboxydothermus islandicus]|uniref:DUF1638 domain-containing protein n=1 Tax=Carboxydothermus islandicus TaxID=661089 RepID=A0A1L8D275_9THEO|nr:DUF1638 domain-containing protein [Carboxydothermus islandicus]GAV25201.1 hypothetical protein ciss_11340 [Carboxydothermus islandicus]